MKVKIIHGRSLYRNHGCRCKICRQANADYIKTWRQAKKTQRISTSHHFSWLVSTSHLIINPREGYWYSASKPLRQGDVIVTRVPAGYIHHRDYVTQLW